MVRTPYRGRIGPPHRRCAFPVVGVGAIAVTGMLTGALIGASLANRRIHYPPPRPPVIIIEGSTAPPQVLPHPINLQYGSPNSAVTNLDSAGN